jgi:gas vesicle protein
MNQLTQHSIDAGASAPQNFTNKAASAGTNLSYLLIGGGIGAALALLFAPKPGAELRGDIATAAQKGYDNTLEMAQKMMDQSRDLYGNLKARADDMTGGAATKLEGKVMDTVSDYMPNGGGEILEGLTDTADGGRDKGSAQGTNTGF